MPAFFERESKSRNTSEIRRTFPSQQISTDYNDPILVGDLHNIGKSHQRLRRVLPAMKRKHVTRPVPRIPFRIVSQRKKDVALRRVTTHTEMGDDVSSAFLTFFFFFFFRLIFPGGKSQRQGNAKNATARRCTTPANRPSQSTRQGEGEGAGGGMHGVTIKGNSCKLKGRSR